jgi:thymidylate synthase
LLWFIKGDTNTKRLAEKGVHIWDGNSSRAYLDSVGLTHLAEGDIGPGYGFQWRHYGAKYIDCNSDYTDCGKDQLSEVVAMIKKVMIHPNDPSARRILLNAWNPTQIHEMALPPCHVVYQFDVDVDQKELSCVLFQRSGDFGLGVPFNIMSASLLTHMLAHVCGLKAGDFVHTIGNAHLYVSHMDALKEQLQRKPKPFPKIRFNRKVDSINDFNEEDFTIEGYESEKAIKMDMVP